MLMVAAMESLTSIYAFATRVLRAGLRHLWIVSACVTLCVTAALTFAIVRGPIYTSSMTVKGVDDSDQVGALKRLASLGGIGGLNGNGLLPSYVYLLQSNEVASLLLNRDHIESLLYGDRLNADGTWRRSVLGHLKDSVFAIFGVEAHDRPTVSDVQNSLVQILVVNQDTLSGLVSVGCSSPRPQLCRDLLLSVHHEAEFSLSQARYNEALKARDFILHKLSTTTQLDLRQLLMEPLADAQNRVAMNGLNRPLAAMIIEQPVVPDEPSFPKPALIGLIGLLSGLAMGLAFAARRDNVLAELPHPWASVPVQVE